MDAERCAQLGKRESFVDKEFLKEFPGFSLGLIGDFNDPIRLYILGCRGPRGEKVWYVGMVDSSEMRARLKKPFEGATSQRTGLLCVKSLGF